MLRRELDTVRDRLNEYAAIQPSDLSSHLVTHRTHRVESPQCETLNILIQAHFRESLDRSPSMKCCDEMPALISSRTESGENNCPVSMTMHDVWLQLRQALSKLRQVTPPEAIRQLDLRNLDASRPGHVT
ncbi:MAG: hypothetical protein AAF229_01025 [Pseudomonadota bacterium]